MSEQLFIGFSVADLRPAQLTVGIREVERMRWRWREADKHQQEKLLRQHVVLPWSAPKAIATSSSAASPQLAGQCQAR